jgi:hypothetical protein
MTRPPWVRAIYDFVHEHVLLSDEHGYPEDGSADADHDRISEALNTVLCDIYGHEIIDDQCGIPEHRYCAWCMKREGS